MLFALLWYIQCYYNNHLRPSFYCSYIQRQLLVSDVTRTSVRIVNHYSLTSSNGYLYCLHHYSTLMHMMEQYVSKMMYTATDGEMT